MVHNLGSRRQLLTFLAAASFACFGPMSIARDIANGTFTPQSTVGDVLDEPLFEPFARYLSRLSACCRTTPTLTFRRPAAYSIGSRREPRQTIGSGFRSLTRMPVSFSTRGPKAHLSY